MQNTNKKAILTTLAALMLPVVLQNLLNSIVNSADIFMLASVSQEALSASSLAGQTTFVFNLFPWSITTGAMIIAAQYYGKSDLTVVRQVQAFALDLLLLVGLVFCAACLLIPQGIMRYFTKDQALIDLGASFLRVLGLSYVPMAASQALLAIFKSMGQTRLSAIISTTCLLQNIAGNFIAIRFLFPDDARMAMIGVAVSTVLARGMELLLCLTAIGRGRGVPLHVRDCWRVPRWLMRDFASYTIPVQANNLIYGVALTTLTAIMGHLSSDMVSANAIASNLRDLVSVAGYALGTAGSILLGQQMGAGMLAKAKETGHMLERLSLILGAAAGVLLLCARAAIVRFSGLTGNAAQLLSMMIPVCAVYCIGRSYNGTLISGIFCAGGDTRFGVILDTITMWVIVVPASYLAAFVLDCPPLVIYLFLNLDEFVKMIPSALRLRRYRWLRNLTREHA